MTSHTVIKMQHNSLKIANERWVMNGSFLESFFPKLLCDLALQEINQILWQSEPVSKLTKITRK